MSRLLNGINTISLCYGCAERHSPSLQICPRCVTGAVNAGCNRCGLIFLIAFCVLLVLALLGCHPKAACSVWGFLYKRWVNTQGGVILCLGSERKKKRIWEQWCSATEVVLRSISAQRQNPAQQKAQEDEADMCKTFFFFNYTYRDGGWARPRGFDMPAVRFSWATARSTLYEPHDFTVSAEVSPGACFEAKEDADDGLSLNWG